MAMVRALQAPVASAQPELTLGESKNGTSHEDSWVASKGPAAPTQDQTDNAGVAETSTGLVGGIASGSAIAAGGNPLTCDQLPQFIEAETRALGESTYAPGSAPLPSEPGRQVVKELDVELAPAGLGTVTVKMRLNDGKLSVVMEVSNANALMEIQREQGAILDRLGSNDQPLESLVIRQSTIMLHHGDTRHVSQAEPESRSNEQGGSDRPSQQDRTSHRRDSQAYREGRHERPMPRGRIDDFRV
jgi:hypothetical protein